MSVLKGMEATPRLAFGSLLVLLLTLFATGCQTDQTARGNTVSGKGMIRHMQLEGGFFGIVTDAGERFLPENLERGFQQDSMRVAFEGVVTNRPTTAMWGRTITITHIEKIP